MPTLSFLVTNDDGIDSPLLAALVAAVRPHGRVVVAAPSGERSWISKAISRHAPRLRAERRDELFDVPAWSIDGTPADCVNLALGRLVEGRVDLVLSGINMGSNAGLPLILASGTVGGALEGALGGAHAVATSIRLGRADFDRLKAEHGTMPAHLTLAVSTIALRSVELALRVARTRRSRTPVVHNLNFPAATTPETVVERTVPAIMSAGPLFAPVADEPGVFTFAFQVGPETSSRCATDRGVGDDGRASHSVLDFGRLGVAGGAYGRVATQALPRPVAS